MFSNYLVHSSLLLLTLTDHFVEDRIIHKFCGIHLLLSFYENNPCVNCTTSFSAYFSQCNLKVLYIIFLFCMRYSTITSFKGVKTMLLLPVFWKNMEYII